MAVHLTVQGCAAVVQGITIYTVPVHSATGAQRYLRDSCWLIVHTEFSSLRVVVGRNSS